MSRILLALDHPENQRLLAGELHHDQDVIIAEADEDLDRDFDVCVLDGRSLDRLWERVRERKVRAEPLFLPVLLVTSRPNVRMITRHLWQSVDELIITPIEKPELRARIQILLRARHLSLALQERAAAAQTAATMRDEVMSMVSHDLRNPLNIVLSNTSLLLEMDPDLGSKQRARLQSIHRAVDQMSRLTEDLLDVSGLDSGQIKVQPKPEDPATLAEHACELHRAAAQTKSVTLSCHVEDGMKSVLADRQRIDQLFGNLIGNALKFAPASSTVRVRAEPATDGVRFTVSDSGPGIEGGDQRQVFDRFWRGAGSKESGAGLGLAIAKSIVDAHGGRIGVGDSTEGGAEFWFELPEAR